MQVFSWQPGTRIVCGADAIEKLAELAAQLKSARALVVTDQGVASAGHATRAADVLRRASLTVHVFSEVQPNPSTDDVDRSVAAARDFDPDLLIGLGGGSAMDCAKGANFVLSNGGRIEDYRGYGKAIAPMLPLIAIPTTAGTGSEVQSYALISDGVTHQKMACGDPKARPWAAILDPQLLQTTPPAVAAMAAIDAISHSVESYVTTGRNPASIMLSRESFRLLSKSVPDVLQTPDDIGVWGRAQWGACLAGMAIEQSMLGAAHALANPLTAHFDIPHGQAVAVCLPHVVRFNATTSNRHFQELVAEIDPSIAMDASDVLAGWLSDLTRALGLRVHLSELGVQAESLPKLAVEASSQWTAQHNPRSVSADSALALYQAAW